MSNPMQSLHTLGINPFAVTLLAESMLKSAYVNHCGPKPLTFEFPVRRGDCEGWAGVRITIEAVPAPDGVPPYAVAGADVQADRIVVQRGSAIGKTESLPGGVPASRAFVDCSACGGTREITLRGTETREPCPQCTDGVSVPAGQTQPPSSTDGQRGEGVR